MNDPRTMVDQYVAAANAKDADALAALYAPTFRVFDMLLPWQQRSADAWRESIGIWLGMSESDALVAEADDIDVLSAEGMAAVSCVMKYFYTNGEGEPDYMQNRLTWVLVPDGDGWLIAHEHTSVPMNEDAGAPEWKVSE